MKKLILFAILLLPVVVTAQTKKEEPVKFLQIYNAKFWTSCGLMFGAGIMDANMQVIQTDYASFKAMFPGANDDYWDPVISWKNKYKNGDPSQGAKFWGSMYPGVGLTDGWHGMQTTRNLFIAGAVTLPLIPSKKVYLIDSGGMLRKGKPFNPNRKWYVIASKYAAELLFFNAGKQLTFWTYKFNR